MLMLLFNFRNSRGEPPESTVHFNQERSSVSLSVGNTRIAQKHETSLTDRPPAPSPRSVSDVNQIYVSFKENPTVGARRMRRLLKCLRSTWNVVMKLL